MPYQVILSAGQFNAMVEAASHWATFRLSKTANWQAEMAGADGNLRGAEFKLIRMRVARRSSDPREHPIVLAEEYMPSVNRSWAELRLHATKILLPVAVSSARKRYAEMAAATGHASESQVDFAQEAANLLELVRNRKALTEDRAKVRAIGERLNAAGGLDAMRMAEGWVRQQFPHGEGGESGWHPAEISAVWDGIGEWLW